MLLSIVIPCYNEGENVALFYGEAVNALKDHLLETEFIFINDGSRDQTLDELKKIHKNSPYNINIINFSRNFGKEAALLAGFNSSCGDYVAIIDADLQQKPSYIIDMLEILKVHNEYDCVAAYQDIRKEGKILSFLKKCF